MSLNNSIELTGEYLSGSPDVSAGQLIQDVSFKIIKFYMSQKFMESHDSNPKVPLKRKGSAIKAIIIALLVDCFGLYILGFIVFLIVSFILILTGTEASLDQIGYKMIEIGTSMQDAEPLLQNNMTSSQSNEASSQLESLMVFVLMCHVLGGYLCARIANHYEYRYSAIVGFIACTFWVVMNIDKNSVIENAICTVLIFIAGLFGASLYASNKTNKRIKPTTNNHAI